MFSSFSYELKKILIDSKKEMKLLKHSYIGTEHIVLSILNKKNNISAILNSFNITYDNFKEKVIELIGYGNEKLDLYIFTPLMKKIIEDSSFYSQDKNEEVTLNTLFNFLLEEGEGVAYRIFINMGVDLDELYEQVNKKELVKYNNHKYIDEIGININKLVKSNKIDPVVGRDKEVKKLIEIIFRKTKCNPLLIGPAGVGKTAIVEELSRRIVNGDVPYKLQNKEIVSISMASLVSGTKYRGEFEEKILNIIKEVEEDNNIILFIDEIHTLVGAGGADGAIDASNILKPALARGNITVIGATTIDEYKKYIEDDKALARRFQNIIVEEPNEEELLNILTSVKTNYEEYHNVSLTDDILKYIMFLSKKYLFSRKEPDRSIDIIDEVCSKVSTRLTNLELKNYSLKKELKELVNSKNKSIKDNDYSNAIILREKERNIESLINNNYLKINNNKKIKHVLNNDVDEIIMEKCNIKLFEKDNIDIAFNKYKKIIKRKLYGKDNVIDELIELIKKMFIIDNNYDRPLSIILSGSKGTGKKYLTDIISKTIFNKNIIKVNLNEFIDDNKIIGNIYNKSIFEELREKPCSIIVFNFFDYCGDSVKNLIYQILDTGYINDYYGNKIDFKNTLIVFLKDLDIKELGFINKSSNDNSLYNKVNKVFKFDELSYENIYKIIESKINSKIDYKIIDRIINESNYKKDGASKLDYLINKYIFYTIA